MDFIEKRNQKTKILLIMGILVVIFAFIAIVFSDSLEKQNGEKLLMVSVLFRHGEKNPTSFYPNDPYSKLNWPGGLGALTQKGILQAYNLGKNLRIRYHKLLPENGIYSQENMKILSSAAERCIMTAQSLLSSFAPPLIENNNLPIMWQPIPVKPIPRDEDTILAQKKICLKYDSILHSFYETPSFDLKKLNEQNVELFQFLSNQTGKEIRNVLDVELLYNTLKTEIESGLKLPEWTKQIFPDTLRPLAERSYILFTETSFMKKVKGGAFLREVISNMKRINGENNKKIYLYSGHDVTLVNVLNSLGILNQTDNLPQFCSALALELHINELLENGVEIKISYYHDSTIVDPINILIPNCNAPCSLKQFTESINELLFDDYNKLCENVSKDCKNNAELIYS